jgi:hypothetical protein
LLNLFLPACPNQHPALTDFQQECTHLRPASCDKKEGYPIFMEERPEILPASAEIQPEHCKTNLEDTEINPDNTQSKPGSL